MKETGYKYAEVEAALCRVFRVTDGAVLALRGRLKAYQRAGLTPESPGRGKVISYSICDIYDWALALSLQDFGIAPDTIVTFVKEGRFCKYWIQSMNDIRPDHLFFCVFPFVFKAIGSYKLTFVMARGADISAKFITQTGGRVAFIDVTALKDSVDSALGADP